MMTHFLIWLGIAFILFILELIITSSFALLCFSVGSVCAGLAGLAGLGTIGQLIVFAVSSLLAFLFLRPILISRLNKRSESRPKTNNEALIGRKARVLEHIDGNRQTGRIAVDGDNWQAISRTDEAIEPGEWVVIEDIDSIVMIVKKL